MKVRKILEKRRKNGMSESMELKKLRALRIWLQREKQKLEEAKERGQHTQWIYGFESAIVRVQNKMTELEL